MAAVSKQYIVSLISPTSIPKATGSIPGWFQPAFEHNAYTPRSAREGLRGRTSASALSILIGPRSRSCDVSRNEVGTRVFACVPDVSQNVELLACERMAICQGRGIEMLERSPRLALPFKSPTLHQRLSYALGQLVVRIRRITRPELSITRDTKIVLLGRFLALAPGMLESSNILGGRPPTLTPPVPRSINTFSSISQNAWKDVASRFFVHES